MTGLRARIRHLRRRGAYALDTNDIRTYAECKQELDNIEETLKESIRLLTAANVSKQEEVTNVQQ